MENSSKILKRTLAYSGKWIKFYLTDYSIGDKIFENYESIQRISN